MESPTRYAARVKLALACSLAVACGPQPPVLRPTAAHAAAAPVMTRVAPDTLAVLDAWTTAAGGKAAIAALGALHAQGSYEKGGMRGTIDLWITPRGERREDIVLGELHETRVFDGTRGWLVDRNREVRELAGFELDDALVLAFRDSFAPLVTERRGGNVTREGDGLVIAPDGGKRTEHIHFDRMTHLPDTLVRRDGEKLRTTHLADYNAVAGVKLPFTVREETGNPNESVVVHYKTLDRGVPPADAFARPPDRAPDMTLATSPVTVPIEIAFDGLIFVKVTVNNTPMSFIVDTGAESTVLSASRVGKLGLQAIGKFATGAGGGDVTVAYVPHVTMHVGDAAVSDQIVAAIMLDQFEVMLRRPLDGILGYDFLSRFVVELDYVHKTMRLRDRATYHHAPGGIPMTLEDSTPYFDAAITVPRQGDLPGHFVLDTGCLCEVTLFTPFVDEHGLLNAFPAAKQQGYSAGAGGTTNQLTATIPALRLGMQTIANPSASLSRDTSGATANPESAGLVGSLVWKRFLLVLDYRGKQFYLDPLQGP